MSLTAESSDSSRKNGPRWGGGHIVTSHEVSCQGIESAGGQLFRWAVSIRQSPLVHKPQLLSLIFGQFAPRQAETVQIRPRGVESKASSHTRYTAQIKDHGWGWGGGGSSSKLTVSKKMICELVRVLSQNSADASTSQLLTRQMEAPSLQSYVILTSLLAAVSHFCKHSFKIHARDEWVKLASSPLIICFWLFRITGRCRSRLLYSKDL